MCVFPYHLKCGEAGGGQAFEAGQVWVQIPLPALENCEVLSKLF